MFRCEECGIIRNDDEKCIDISIIDPVTMCIYCAVDNRTKSEKEKKKKK